MNYKGTFIKNEYRSILGKKWVNFWILLSVFFVSLAALSMSRAGLRFLNKKMDDPFINWVNVSNEPRLDEFHTELFMGVTDDSISYKQYFDIKDVEKNNYLVEFVKGNRRIIGRTLDYRSELWKKILDHTNIRHKALRNTPIDEKDFGWVVTADFLKELGYAADSIPLFVSLEYTTSTSSHFVPIPLMAVVDRLPDDIDFVATNYFYEQLGDLSHPFDIGDSARYFSRLLFVAKDAEDARKILADELSALDLVWEDSPKDYELSWDDASLLSAVLYDTKISVDSLYRLCQNIENKYGNIYRYYDYAWGKGYPLKPDYVSVMFNRLDKVRVFQQWAKNHFDIRIDMAQIEAKENFRLFEKLASWLSWCIVVLSVLFVAIFLYFLSNAHFQKIAKNLGTIRAFGLSKTTINGIYLCVFMSLIGLSLLAAGTLVVLLQGLFALCRIGYSLNGQMLPYLRIEDGLVLGVIACILLASGFFSWFFTSRKLQATPGDLIYERHNL